MKKKNLIYFLAFAVVLLIIASLVGCDKAKDLLFKAPENVAYDGQYITWDKVDGAKHYMVSINGGEEVRSNSTTYTFESSDVVEVVITAVFDKIEKSTSITFKPLTPIEELLIEDNGEVSWGAVNGANAYSVSVNGQVTTVTDTRITTLPSGNNRVKVKPIVSGDSSFYSKYSKEINVNIYTTPTNVKYDGTMLSWSGNASKYLVTLNGVANEVQGNTLRFNSDNKDFLVEVKALGNHKTTFDSKSAKEEFFYLDTVTNIFVEDGLVKWNAVDKAQGYKIKIGGVVQKVDITDTLYDKIASGKSQDIAIMPYNNSGNYFSSWSTEKTIYILDTPQVSWNNSLALDGEANNNVTWNAVNAASGYTARLIKDGGTPEITTYSDIQLAFANAYANVGVYTIEIKANADSGSSDYYDSKYSSPIYVERLAAPKAVNDNFIVSDRDNLARGFTVNFLKVSGASGYQLYKNDKYEETIYTTNSITDSNVVEKEGNINDNRYSYKVRSVGGEKTLNGKKYVTLPCLTSEALSFEIIVQSTPQNLKMQGFNLSWDAVDGNNGYTVSYAGTNMTAQIASCDLSTLAVGSYSVAVNARGNGGNLLASEKSAPVAIQRLQAPTNMKIRPSGTGSAPNGQEITVDGTGLLLWDKVANASSYNAYLGSSKTPLDANAYGDMYQYIDTTGTTLSMVAVANEYNKDKTLYYMTSPNSPTQQFIRLAAPTFPTKPFENGVEFVWNAPRNMNTSVYTPTYVVTYDNEGRATTGTKYNIASLPSRTYQFTVRAIGNDTMYLDSEESVEITATKIETPTIRIENNQYVWNNVNAAISYYLEIDGKKAADEFAVEGGSFAFKPRFTTIGTHIVKIKAVGDGKGTIDSSFFEFNQEAKKLNAPSINARYSDESFVKDGKIVAKISTPSANCAGYSYMIAGETKTSTELECSKVIEFPGSYEVSVTAIGGTFDANNVYYIDSNPINGGTFVILGSPASFSMQAGQIQWKAVAGAKYGYEYQIAYGENGEYEQIKVVTGPALSMPSDFRKYKKVKVRVRAKGSSDGTTITGGWVEWTWDNPNGTI